jgi:predicted metal-dependent TIM-barrel fold hydrolase
VIRIKEAIKIINRANFKTIAVRVYDRALLADFFNPEKKTTLTIVEIIKAPDRKRLISKSSGQFR